MPYHPIYCVVADRIYVSFEPIRVVESIVVAGGTIIYAGDLSGAERVCRLLGCETVDYSGYTVMPGFVDSHIHLSPLSISDRVVDLSSVRSIAEALERVSRAGFKRIIVGRGWSEDRLAEHRPITGADIDRVINRVPVILFRICGHVAAANRKAVELALEKLPEKLHKLVDRGKGLIYEDALEKLSRIIERIEYDLEDLVKAMERNLLQLANMGITGVGVMSATIEQAAAYHIISGRATVPWARFYIDAAEAPRLIRARVKPGILGIIGVKAFADGSLGARTAHLTQPYSDKPDTKGIGRLGDEVKRVLVEAYRLGYHMAVHAIGDAALDNVMGFYKLIKARRERIEHASLIRDDQLKDLIELDAMICTNPGFILSDTWALSRLGPQRIRWLYRLRTIYGAGIVVGFGSDSPVEPANPWRNIYAAVGRGCAEGLDIFKYTPGESLDKATAIHIHTVGSATILYEGSRGILAPGHSADYIVVDRDPLETGDPRELLKIRVVETRIYGRRPGERDDEA